MKDRGLIALNVVLLVLLAGVTLSSTGVVGQSQPGARSRGDYTAVGGKIQGGNANAIFVLDAVNQELVALRWNETTKSLEGIDFRDLARDARAAAGGPAR